MPSIELRIREIQLAARRVDLGPEAYRLAPDDDGEARGLRLRFGWPAITNHEAYRCSEAHEQQARSHPSATSIAISAVDVRPSKVSHDDGYWLRRYEAYRRSPAPAKRAMHVPTTV